MQTQKTYFFPPCIKNLEESKKNNIFALKNKT